MIAIVDYGMGNLRSVQKALEHVGARAVVTHRPAVIRKAAKIVLPGVGAFDRAMAQLKRLRLVDVLRRALTTGRPYLGICLGLQLLFEWGEEGPRPTRGLGIFPGRVVRFRRDLTVPHMGWNHVQPSVADPSGRLRWNQCPLLSGVAPGRFFYFVHSYYALTREQATVVGTTDYGRSFTSMVWWNQLFATQFHPEKSQAVGLRVLRNFARL